jgi:ribonuclease-3 family protein
MLLDRPLPAEQARLISMRLLAHLGDAVLHLFEREREILVVSSAQQMHSKTVSRVSAGKQAEFLDLVADRLTDLEQDIVRRARNVKPSGYRKAGQNAYRKATAYEALIGYLYLTDYERMHEILQWTITDSTATAITKKLL